MIPQTSAEVISHADAVRIREVLGDVLQSAPFRTTRQCQSLLKYIVEHTLAGENDLLRERVIGTEVFGRSHDYEPGDDPVVRVRAAEVRKRLAQYYQDRADSLVRIDIPSGSYRAVFQWKAAQLTTPASPKPGLQKSRWRWALVAVLVIAASAMVVRGLRTTPSSAPSAMDQFWAPALTSPKPILVYNATSTVFQSPDLTDSPHGLVPVSYTHLEIAPEFGDIRTDRYGLAIAGRGAQKVAPGLGVVSLGQERFEPGVPIRLRNSQSRSRQGYREYCAHALTSTTSTQIEYRVEEGKPRLFQTPNP